MATERNSSDTSASKSTGAAPEFVITRVLDAPRALVFKMWTDPRHMAKWFGPRSFTNPVCELDPRTGGAHRIVMRSPDGVDYPIKGVYWEVVEAERIVMTQDCSEHPPGWHDLVDPNRPTDNANPAGILLTTVTFEDVSHKTKLTVRTRFETAAIRDAMLKMGMTEGWSQTLDRLAEYLAVTRK